MKQHFITLYRILCVVYVILFSVLWFAGEKNSFFEGLITFPWWMYLIPMTIISLMYFFIIKRYPYSALAVIFFAAIPFIFTVRTVSTTFPEKNNNSIKMCILNSQFFFMERDLQKVLTKLKSYQCDVYLFQEFWPVKPNKEESLALIDKYFNDYSVATKGEFISLSKYPIVSTKLSPHEGFFKVIINKEGIDISLYNVHLWNPFSGRDCLSFGTDIYKNDCILSPYDIRLLQTNELRTELHQETNQMVIGGDFNSMQNTKIIQDLNRDFQILISDSFGLNATFLSYLPLVKIDYFFVPKSYTKTSLATQNICDSELSDHCLGVYQFDINDK